MNKTEARSSVARIKKKKIRKQRWDKSFCIKNNVQNHITQIKEFLCREDCAGKTEILKTVTFHLFFGKEILHNELLLLLMDT